MPIFRSLSIVMVGAILLNAIAPALAYAATYLQGAEVNPNTLIRDAYVAVTYYDNKGKQKLSKGWINAIDETTFEIRSRAIFGKETIAYDKVLSVIMSEESTTPIEQINEVDRFMRKREIEQAKQDRLQAVIQKLNQKPVTVMVHGQIDSSYTLHIATLVGYSAGAFVCLLSTLIGATIKSNKWVEVPPDRLNLSIAPTSTCLLR